MEEEVYQLAENLQREHNYVRRERGLIQNLYLELVKGYETLFRDWWILQSQRASILSYIQSGFGESATLLSARFFELDTVDFIRAFTVVQYDEFYYADLLRILRSHPELSAQMLLQAQAMEQVQPGRLQKLCNVVYSTVFGSCVCPEDEAAVLVVLRWLITHEVAPSLNPRKVLLSGNCAFSKLLGIYVENLVSAKKFLTGVLYQPLLKILTQNDWYYDISEKQLMERFPQAFRCAKFGTPGTEEFQMKVAKYRTDVVQCLVGMANAFIVSLQQHLHLFPQSYLRLLGFLSQEVSVAGNLDATSISRMCTEFVFECFLYPAIVDPETYGVTSDFVISNITRHNLMEVGKIIQTLLYQSPLQDGAPTSIPHPQDVFGHFKPDCLTQIMASLMSAAKSMEDASPGQLMNKPQDNLISRSVALVTPSGLNILLESLRTLINSPASENVECSPVAEVLNQLPEAVTVAGGTTSSTGGSGTLSATQIDTSGSFTNSPSRIRRLKQRSTVPTAWEDSDDGSRYDDSPRGSAHEGHVTPASSAVRPLENVLIFSLQTDYSCPGMLTEHKVLDMENAKLVASDIAIASTAPTTSSSSSSSRPSRVSIPLEMTNNGPAQSIAQPTAVRGPRPMSSSSSATGLLNAPSATETVEKRTRFSLSHDQESLCTTSDCLEAVSEVAGSEIASTHSAPSVDLEYQEEGDALSDMVLSANVSGRGTPSISGGRDSPLSGSDLPLTVQKPDVTDKFGKFDIPPSRPSEIEARSTVSDTWSTDVLASDSETTEAAESQQRLVDIVEEIAPNSHRHHHHRHHYQHHQQHHLSVASTAQNPPSQSHHSRDSGPGSSRGAGGGSGGGSVGSVDVTQDSSEKTADRMADFDLEDLEATSTGRGGPPSSSCGRGGGDSSDSPSSEEDPDDQQQSQREDVLLGRCTSPLGAVGGREEQGDQQTAAKDTRTLLEQFDPLRRSRSSGGGGSAFTPTPQQSAVRSSNSRVQAKLRSLFPTSSTTNNASKGDSGVVSFASLTTIASTTDGGMAMSADRRGSSEMGGSEKGGVKSRGGNVFSEGFTKIKDKMTRTSNPNRRKKVVDRDSLDTSTSNRSSGKYYDVISPTETSVPVNGMHRGPVDSPSMRGSSTLTGGNVAPVQESVEDMMARYRRKAALDTSASSTPAPPVTMDTSPDLSPPTWTGGDFFDAANVQTCPAWQDAKRKLRLVLSTGGAWEGGVLPLSDHLVPVEQRQRENDLVRVLRGLLADAINLQEHNLIAQLQETLRVIRLFDNISARRLLSAMEEDWRGRRSYLAYLVRTRDQLCLAKHRVDELLKRCKRNRSIAARHMISLCLRELIKQEQGQFDRFTVQFQRVASQTTSDEKQRLVREILDHMLRQLSGETFFRAAQPDKAAEARRYLERMVMSQIYPYTMNLNDSLAEVERDGIYERELRGLGDQLTFRDLHIPAKYNCVSPFESAQEELRLLNCFKTPGDKVDCIKRVNDNIIHMLKMANSNLVPCADDLLPVLIFVIIHANPTRLMSNVAYVETYYNERLDGELEYVWCQFRAAVEQVKVMVSEGVTKGRTANQ